MIKISHESPIALLPESLVYNDYDYCLVHLLDTEPVYYSFFVDSIKKGRTVLLDNSIFELGKSFDAVKYRDWINRLKPTEFIIPDVLEDCNGTIDQLNEWELVTNMRLWHNKSKTIGVVQGKNYAELVKCYVAVDSICDKIAISFDYSYYREVFPHPNKWVSSMMGRVITLTRLMNDGIINKNKPHHLLGNASPLEFSFYNTPEYSWIESLDTSSPIVHGLKGIKYNNNIGAWNKESTKLVDLLKQVPNKTQLENIRYNIDFFRKSISNS